MKIGDIINVLRISMFNGTMKIPARVISIGNEAINVEAIRGAFDEEGRDRLALHLADYGRTWE